MGTHPIFESDFDCLTDMADHEYPDISKLRVVDLKQLCTEYGLDTKGKKAELQAKLLSYFEANPKTDNPSEENIEQAPEEEPAMEQEIDQPVEEPVQEQIEEHVEEPQQTEPEPVAEPINEPIVEEVEEPVVSTVTDQRQEPLENVAEKEPIAEENVEEPVKMETDDQPPPLVAPEPEPTSDPKTPPPLVEPDVEKSVQEEPTNQEPPKSPEKEPMAVDDAPAKKPEESSTTKRERKSRWTETAKVVIGAQLSAPVEAPRPVPRKKEDGTKLTKAQRKKLKKKRRKEEKKNVSDSGVDTENDKSTDDDTQQLKVDIDYIAEEPDLDPVTMQFNKVFDAFRAAQFVDNEALNKREPIKQHGDGIDHMAMDEDSEEEDKKGEEKNKLSKKKLKKQSRLTVAELKQIVERPDLVEMHDVTAMDPKLLVLLKSTRNSVAVPRHWSYKRKYLSGKRGIEKPPFELPEFIRKTGIMEMREALQQKESEQGLKAKMRQRVRPKLGKIDIDYQKLHDAFFRYQTKPKMSRHGDIYYEGKEYETRLRELKPGELTDDLRTSLGMPLGNNATKVPPPWLIAMQRYGPPPSYPNLKIPGLNAPIPSGCSFGYHAGGWGKPPVDERGRPLYGDVFGVEVPVNPYEDEKPSEQLWGEIDSDEESSSEDESTDESEEEGDQDGTGVPTAADPTKLGDDGLVTPSGISSQLPDSAQTPQEIELRKNQTQKVDMANPPPLYQVLQEKQVSVGKGMMGTAHVYDLKKAKTTEQGQEISINPEDLDMDPAAIAAKYQNRAQNSASSKEKEDMSDMMQEHLNKTSRDRKRKNAQKDDPKSKKYKDFKF